jgi:hypothetical protein
MEAQRMDNIEAWLVALGLKTSTGGALVAFVGWLSSSAAAAWFGALVGMAGLLITWWFSRRRDRREQEEHDAKMKGLL